MVAAMFLVAVIAWGIGFYGLGFYLRELRTTHGWSLRTVTLATMWFYIASIGTSRIVRNMLQRGLGRPVFALGGVSLAASLVAMSQVDARWQLVPVYLGLALAWSSMSIYPISSMIIAWYPETSGPPLSLALTGASVGGIVLVPVLTDLEGRYGFAASVAGTGVVAGGMLVLLAALVVRYPAADSITAPAAPAAPATPSDPDGDGDVRDSTHRRSLLGDVVFWTLSLGFGLSLTVQVGFLLHELNLLADHLDDAAAARVVAATSVAALIGRLAFGLITRRYDECRITLGYVVVQAAALLLLGTGASSTAALYGAGIGFGLGVGTLVTATPLWTRRLLDRVPFEEAYYRVNVFMMIGAALGPILSTALHDALSGYADAMAVLGVLDVVAVGLLALAWRVASSRSPVLSGTGPVRGVGAG